jgi:predicted outer membrane repeat protein
MLRARRNTSLVVLAALLAACDRSEPTTSPRSFSQRTLNIVAGLPVTNTNDAGPGSLREALALANVGTPGPIQFDPSIAGHTIVLQSTLAVGVPTFDIIGPPQGITISGGGVVRVMDVTGGRHGLTNLTIADGAGAEGAGLTVDNGADVTLDHVTISGNVASAGNGGGVSVFSGTLTVSNSTLSGNSASKLGGGIFSHGTVSLINSTLTNNAASVGGGGIFSVGTTARVVIRNSIIAKNNGTTPNCGLFGVTVLSGLNMVDVPVECGTGPSIIVADPMLGPLASNGGPTKTHALPPGSPAIDAAVDCTVADDQRHVARPLGSACDIGAFEFSNYTTLGVSINPAVVVSPNTGVAVVIATLTCSAPAAITLVANLTQPQKNGRGSSTAQASTTSTVGCGGSTIVAVSLAPVTGAFESGAATASIAVSNPNAAVIPASSTAPVKLSWGHK